MELGIFAKTFARPSLEATLDAVAEHGLTCIQFNMACAGLPPLPDRIEDGLCDRIAGALAARRLRMAAVSGTFNMIDPDEAKRWDGLRRLRVLASACRGMGTSVITLCTGTRDPDNMWRRHPENDSAAAWGDLVGALRPALEFAEEFDVTLAFEPETANVIDSARKARRLLDELASPRLKVVLDPINLPGADHLPHTGEILEEAFALCGQDVVIAHGKDKRPEAGEAPVAIGAGVLDLDRYVRLLPQLNGNVPLIIHGVDESQVAQSVALVRSKLAAEEGR